MRRHAYYTYPTSPAVQTGRRDPKPVAQPHSRLTTDAKWQSASEQSVDSMGPLDGFELRHAHGAQIRREAPLNRHFHHCRATPDDGIRSSRKIVHAERRVKVRRALPNGRPNDPHQPPARSRACGASASGPKPKNLTSFLRARWSCARTPVIESDRV